jgi:hypothetical protein
MAQTRKQKISEDLQWGARRAEELEELKTQVFDSQKKVRELDPEEKYFYKRLKQQEVLQASYFRLLNKYWPDVKSIEADLTSSDGSMSPPTVIELVAKTLD